MKTAFVTLLAVTLLGTVRAQQPTAEQEYEAFRNRSLQEYASFRDRVNAEYAEFVRHPWKRVESRPALPLPKPDPPVAPHFRPDDRPAEPQTVPFDTVTPPREPVVQPRPVEPIPDPVDPVGERMTFDLFGATCSVRIDRGTVAPIEDTSERSVAEAWKRLSGDRSRALLQDCLRLRDSLHLCDWAYVQLCRSLSAALYGSADTNDGVLLRAYLLSQSCYAMRLARSGNRLYLLLPPDVVVYGRKFLEINGTRFYIFDSSFQGGGLRLCDFAFPGEKPFSLYIERLPALPDREVFCRVFDESSLPETGVPFCPNQNLMRFFDTYPYCRWDVHALTPLSDKARQALYPALRQAIAGKSPAEAANVLIHFVQRAFDYQTDQQQFGYERPLFADETLNYPYSDCEDRSILFSVLIRELLGLDVVLINYPNHLATAVCFDEEVTGDYLEIDRRRFIVCDPTYIGADIGRTMPGMDNQTAEIIRL